MYVSNIKVWCVKTYFRIYDVNKKFRQPSMSILHSKTIWAALSPKNAQSSFKTIDHDTTKKTNGMFHVPMLCLSLVLVVIIVQHAVFLWYISFRISGGHLSMYNRFFRGERGCYYSTCIKKEKMRIWSWLRKLFIMDCKIILFDRKGIVIKINFSLNKNTSYYMWFQLVAVWIL